MNRRREVPAAVLALDPGLLPLARDIVAVLDDVLLPAVWAFQFLHTLTPRSNFRHYFFNRHPSLNHASSVALAAGDFLLRE